MLFDTRTHLMREEEARAWDSMAFAIERALYPFRPGRISVEIVEHFEPPWRIYEVRIDALPDQPAYVHDHNLDRFGDLGFLMTELGIRAGKQFAQIYVQPEGHIHLGEE